MPVVNGRLTCCTCGADLGDASDPYRDPDCWECLKAEWDGYAAEAEDEDREDEEAWQKWPQALDDRSWELTQPLEDLPF